LPEHIQPAQLLAYCKERSVLISPWKHGTVRLVFHYDIDSAMLLRAIDVVCAGLREL
jgi:hypothetical protein